jgi:Tol biopolymer transport system component
MNRKLFIASASFLALCTSTACKKDKPHNNQQPNNLKGTLVFGEAVDEVADITLGTDASAVLFQGSDPSWTPDGRILYSLNGDYTDNGKEQIHIANTNGTGVTKVADFGEYNQPLYANPKISRDGKFASFNYYDHVNYTPLGLEIYSTDGTLVYTAKNYWDGSWAPDGSVIVAGSVYSIDNSKQETYGTPGLFKLSSDFKTVTPVGSGLTNPWYPCVSPDGKKIAFAMNSHIWVINIDGTGLKQVTAGPNEETYSCWSPDGAKLAIVSNGNIGSTYGNALAIVDSDPANPITVSQNENIWVKDKNNSLGLLNPIGNVSWK